MTYKFILKHLQAALINFFQGSLPLVLIFEMGEEEFTESDDINVIMNHLDVSIMVRQKLRYNIMSVIIKGIERKAGKFNLICVINLILII